METTGVTTEHSLGEVAIIAVYGVQQRRFLTLLEYVVRPARVGLVFNMNLVVAKLRPAPLLPNNDAEPFERAIVRPIDDAMVVKPVVGTGLNNRNHQ